MTRSNLKFVLLLAASFMSGADIVVENDLIIPEEIFDFVFSTDSPAYWTDGNVTKYYCVYRNLWTPEQQPKLYPKLARISNPALYSSTKQFLPWLKNRATTLGVEQVAEAGFTDTFHTEVLQAGELVHQYGEGKGFFVNQEDNTKNYCYMDGIEVNVDYPFLSGLAGIQPSPDWFTGFYLFNVIDEYDRTYWDRFRLHSYPWDAGTDEGDTYTSLDRDNDPPLNVERVFPENAPNGIFVSPEGEVLPVAEWECILYTCAVGVEAQNCIKPDWPPANGCDVLRYPGCDTMCDPDVDEICQECIPKNEKEGKVYYPNCCQSGYDPKPGTGGCDYSAASRVTFASVALFALLATFVTLF